MAATCPAAVYTGIKKPFELTEYPLPEPDKGGMLIEVSLTNVCGSDLHIWRGDTDLARSGVDYPIILGHEMVGRVARLGQGAGDDALGRDLTEADRVAFTDY